MVLLCRVLEVPATERLGVIEAGIAVQLQMAPFQRAGQSRWELVDEIDEPAVLARFRRREVEAVKGRAVSLDAISSEADTRVCTVHALEQGAIWVVKGREGI